MLEAKLQPSFFIGKVPWEPHSAMWGGRCMLLDQSQIPRAERWRENSGEVALADTCVLVYVRGERGRWGGNAEHRLLPASLGSAVF